ncbi:unnamed protein product [Dimorphilus gyrociliatus]|uniref:Integrator complex subunit 11 n=1 Tax=Dimorphilus gyrociliatus TaxID=2664684 RepID=A0A7I8W4I3_9ANNE|nr:unnamed protein product [Dimorphilus gyrociliatus]
MTEIRAIPLGAGQDVGRSCILIEIGGKNIMLDCGMHMGYNDDRRFPDFSFIRKSGDLTPYLDCVIISHFHLDHCGALPYMTEMVGYNGPIYMTHPTKAVCPILLEDYRKLTVEKKGEQNFFTSEMIKKCMSKCVAVNLHQTIQVDSELRIKPYYAGHVLGAAMFHVEVKNQSLVYTGDYNMTPDRHLGAASIDKCRPDLLITESTYATTIRDSKRCRERDFLQKVHECVERDGKVLIPVFALGRAQELCILLETYWERMNLKVPIYFAVGLTEKANNYYKMFITWTNQKIKQTFLERNMFEFKHIRAFDRSFIENPGSMVVLATPGMLHSGLSLQIFKKWAPFEKNMVIMPGYCVQGTVGFKILSGQRKLDIDGHPLEVKMSVQYMSFSAHADAKGIMQLIGMCEPKNVMLVHGEGGKMQFLKAKIEREYGTSCYMPANGEMAIIDTKTNMEANISIPLLKRTLAVGNTKNDIPEPKKCRTLHAAVVMNNNKLTIVDTDETVNNVLNKNLHHIQYSTCLPIPAKESAKSLFDLLTDVLQDVVVTHSADGTISVDDVDIHIEQEDESCKKAMISWQHEDEQLGSFVCKLIKQHCKSITNEEEN